MIELNTAVTGEVDFTPAQKLLLQITRDFISLDKLDLKCQTMRCYLGHGSNPEVVAKELSKLNTHFWLVFPNPHIPNRLGVEKYVYPRSSEEIWRSLNGSVVCLLSATESYTGGFMRRLESAGATGIFHWGG